MTSAEYNQLFQRRTKAFAVAVIKLCDNLPKSAASSVLAKQAIRSAASVAANYRASCISRSDKERHSKLCIVVEETDETCFWLEMIEDAGMATNEQIRDIYAESKELLKVFMAYRHTLKGHLQEV